MSAMKFRVILRAISLFILGHAVLTLPQAVSAMDANPEKITRVIATLLMSEMDNLAGEIDGVSTTSQVTDNPAGEAAQQLIPAEQTGEAEVTAGDPPVPEAEDPPEAPAPAAAGEEEEEAGPNGDGGKGKSKKVSYHGIIAERLKRVKERMLRVGVGVKLAGDAAASAKYTSGAAGKDADSIVFGSHVLRPITYSGGDKKKSIHGETSSDSSDEREKLERTPVMVIHLAPVTYHQYIQFQPRPDESYHQTEYRSSGGTEAQQGLLAPAGRRKYKTLAWTNFRESKSYSNQSAAKPSSRRQYSRRPTSVSQQHFQRRIPEGAKGYQWSQPAASVFRIDKFEKRDQKKKH